MDAGVLGDLDALDPATEHTAVVSYGSLINVREIEAEFGRLDPVCFPVRLDGFTRVFNNRSAVRRPGGTKSAVLNVSQTPDRWCNAIVIIIGDEPLPHGYQEREQGYRFEDLTANRLRPYRQSHDAVVDLLAQILVPIGERVESDIEPIAASDGSYINLCLEGAAQWEREGYPGFQQEFIETTELADGTPFAEYLERESIAINL